MKQENTFFCKIYVFLLSESKYALCINLARKLLTLRRCQEEDISFELSNFFQIVGTDLGSKKRREPSTWTVRSKQDESK